MAPYPADAGAGVTEAGAHRAVREHHTDNTDVEYIAPSHGVGIREWSSVFALIQIESAQSVVKVHWFEPISRLQDFKFLDYQFLLVDRVHPRNPWYKFLLHRHISPAELHHQAYRLTVDY